MIPTAIIVFREVLEAALIISIVMAASKAVPNRNLLISGGIFAGIIGAGVVAFFASAISSGMQGMGLELFNAIVLFLASGMLGFHIIWMSKHGRELAKQAGDVSKAVIAGVKPVYAIAIICAVAVLREGAETVLFLYGIAAGSQASFVSMASGAAIGLSGGLALGAVLYFSLVKIPLKNFFTITNWMILLLASGLAAQGAGYLVQADIIPSLGDTIWDTSAFLSEQSPIGSLLNILVGYISRPSGVQILFYAATFLVIFLFMKNNSKPQAQKLA
jgi:high-affinity iron transporter